MDGQELFPAYAGMNHEQSPFSLATAAFPRIRGDESMPEMVIVEF